MWSTYNNVIIEKNIVQIEATEVAYNCICIESLTHSGHFLGITLKIIIVEQTRPEVILCGHNACFLSIDII